MNLTLEEGRWIGHPRSASIPPRDPWFPNLSIWIKKLDTKKNHYEEIKINKKLCFLKDTYNRKQAEISRKSL